MSDTCATRPCKKASCDQEAWVLSALYEISKQVYAGGIRGRIESAKNEAAIHQAAVEILEVLGYAPCYENIKRLTISK